MSDHLFRKVSLDRLSSPEQLDERIKVTSPGGWLALLAIGGILLSAVVWGFLGSIPTIIEGQGILINNGGVYSVRHHASGQVTDIRFMRGDTVKKGDVIARIEVPELVEEINGLLGTVSGLKSKGEANSPEYQEMENRVSELRKELDRESQIVSPMDGSILESNIEEGSIVRPGEALLTMEQYGETVRREAVVYVSAEQGEKIQPGMEAQISPVIVNKEEYGYMLGRVVSVSKYPATAQSMMQTLGNENLASLLAGQGVPLMVRIDLIPDSNTKSGYRWSTPEGPPISVHSGTLIKSAVIVSRQKPISKLIPQFQSTVDKNGEVIR